jgi:hypothetical protein
MARGYISQSELEASVELTNHIIEHDADEYIWAATTFGLSPAFEKLCEEELGLEGLGWVDLEKMKWFAAHVYLAGRHSIHLHATDS